MLPLELPPVCPWRRQRVGAVDAGANPVGQRPPLEEPERAPAQRGAQRHPADVLLIGQAQQPNKRPEDRADSEDKDNVDGYHSDGAPIVSYMA